ncbi:MAG: hypothetical protein AB7U05_08535 [Mangrovibacterium sp.]
MLNQNPCAELCGFVSATGNISKHLRIVHDYAVHASTADGLPAEICSSLSMIGQFMEYIQPVEQAGKEESHE